MINNLNQIKQFMKNHYFFQYPCIFSLVYFFPDYPSQEVPPKHNLLLPLLRIHRLCTNCFVLSRCSYILPTWKKEAHNYYSAFVGVCNQKLHYSLPKRLLSCLDSLPAFEIFLGGYYLRLRQRAHVL